MRYPLIILDRDGVINRESDRVRGSLKTQYICSMDEWLPISGSLEAIAQLKRSGRKVAIATNQSGIGRNLYSLYDFMAIHQELDRRLQHMQVSIDMLEFCPHTPQADCACRKPRPGMLRNICRQLDVAPADTVFIGDASRDLQAAQTLGCTGILVRTGKGRDSELALTPALRPPIFDDLLQAVKWIITAA